VLETIIARNRLKERIRELFKREGFTEVETPLLTPYCNPDDNVENAEALFRDFQGREHRWFLHTSPEFFMKRLIWLGAERIFQIGKVFRSGEITPLHQVEFTMVEWYRVREDFRKGMEESERIVREGAEEFGVSEIVYRGKRVKLEKFERLTVEEAFREFAEVNPFDREEVKRVAGENDYETAFFKLLVERVEPGIGELLNPVFLYGYPEEFSAMAVVKEGVAERFELFIAGVEIANGYTELPDYESYLKKFKKKGECAVDKGFLELLKKKPLPECEGVALGFDRLLMLLTGKERIEEVIPFPTSRLIRESSSS
jgi:lysyl-tRNA synthetase class 2